MIRLIRTPTGNEPTVAKSASEAPSRGNSTDGKGTAPSGQSASEQARLDMEQDAPNDRAIAVFREEIARSGNPQLATAKAMDAWLFAAPTKREGA